ncbi:enoyl-CoA hydratase/isomerase family protein [Nonomuraea sp. NPDC046802]|uniref:enoyl-CoA hydratase/isomerase family protein n=1 Tax=Nonomuraea sp. NPDC046802 TaxID=3154919 RepID=UPI0033DCF3F4
MSQDDVLVRHDGEVAVLTLNRPASLNAWDMAMQDTVRRRFGEFAADDRTRAVVITGAGERAFCAGQHLAETAGFGPENVDAWLDNFRSLYRAVLEIDKPVVAAINGVAAGSGYQLTLLCDVRVAHPGVRMGQTEVSSGIPSITGMYLTMRALGGSRTLELMMSGRLMEADELKQAGLVHHLVPQGDVLATAVKIAGQLAEQPSVAIALTKQRYRDLITPGLWEAFEAARAIDRKAWASGQPQQVMRDFFAARRKR